MDATDAGCLGILSPGPLSVPSSGFLRAWQFSGDSGFSHVGWLPPEYCVTENANMCAIISGVLFVKTVTCQLRFKGRGAKTLTLSGKNVKKKMCASVTIFNLLPVF